MWRGGGGGEKLKSMTVLTRYRNGYQAYYVAVELDIETTSFVQLRTDAFFGQDANLFCFFCFTEPLV